MKRTGFDERDFLPVARPGSDGRPFDVVLVAGEAYVDHPSFPSALLGRWLEHHGFRVGLIPLPDYQTPDDVARLGNPRLFFGVTAGALDSMVANYTALRRRRSDDAYSPGGVAGRRPDRAVTVYCNLIRQAFGKSALIVVGGIEASLRKLAHYDYWSDSVRRGLLLDCGADVLVHGMGEMPILELARRLDSAGGFSSVRSRAEWMRSLLDIPGVVVREPAGAPHYQEVNHVLPDWESVAADPRVQAQAHVEAWLHRDRTLVQRAGGSQILVTPCAGLPESNLDLIARLPFTRMEHPVYRGARIPAAEQVRFSVATHRGCPGGCAFCAITRHQGRMVVSRSSASVLEEIRSMTLHPGFRGTIADVGGPTANAWSARCRLGDSVQVLVDPAAKVSSKPGCNRASCLFPDTCRFFECDQDKYRELLAEASRLEGVAHLFVTTGIRTDLAMQSPGFVRDLAFNHTSGHLKVAPEHVSEAVTGLMRKPPVRSLERFLDLHRSCSFQAGRNQFVIPYFLAAHPGSDLEHMVDVMDWLKSKKIVVEQCQIFTPTPGTDSTVMYSTGLEPYSLDPVFIERTDVGKEMQKALVLYHLPENRTKVAKALQIVRNRQQRPSGHNHESKDTQMPGRTRSRSTGRKRP